MDKVCLQIDLKLSFPTHYMKIYKAIHVYYLNKSHNSLKKSWLKLYMDGLFICHVMGWSKIAPNQFGAKLFPFII